MIIVLDKMNIKELGIEITYENRYKDLLKECYNHATENQHHPSTHNAALLVNDQMVILRGRNVLPMGVEAKKERLTGDNKHIYPNHAERDVIYKAAKIGLKTEGLTMIMPWLPCIPCANAVISAGIEKLIVHKQMIDRTREGWVEELKNAVEIMKEAGVKIIAYDGEVGAKAYMHSQEWNA
jgi:dCMP deaminase